MTIEVHSLVWQGIVLDARNSWKKEIVPALELGLPSSESASVLWPKQRRSRTMPEVRTENLGHSELLQSSRYGRSVITVSHQQVCFGYTAGVIEGVRGETERLIKWLLQWSKQKINHLKRGFENGLYLKYMKLVESTSKLVLSTRKDRSPEDPLISNLNHWKKNATLFRGQKCQT